MSGRSGSLKENKANNMGRSPTFLSVEELRMKYNEKLMKSLDNKLRIRKY